MEVNKIVNEYLITVYDSDYCIFSRDKYPTVAAATAAFKAKVAWAKQQQSGYEVVRALSKIYKAPQNRQAQKENQGEKR